MDFRTNSQKSRIFPLYGNVRFTECSKSIQATPISAPFCRVLLFRIFFYGFAQVFSQVNILGKLFVSLKDQNYHALAILSKSHFRKFILLHSASTFRNFEVRSIFIWVGHSGLWILIGFLTENDLFLENGFLAGLVFQMVENVTLSRY